MVLKVGITGQSGFIGTHLYNFIGIQENAKRIPFHNNYFNNTEQLENFVKSCDVIVHLAAMNRHADEQVIYNTNIDLVKKLILAFEKTNSKPYLLFSSSTQEKKNNLYGKSKFDGRTLLQSWARRNGTQYTNLIIPNVFGPFGKPHYNSFIATFCHLLTHQRQPEIIVDGEVELIYIGELVQRIWKKINDLSANSKFVNEKQIDSFKIPFTSKVKVSKVLDFLEYFHENYFKKGIIPNLAENFEKNLFNTFVCYIDHKNFFPFHLAKHSDDRGSFVETIKLNSGGQVSFSTTVPGITRGNHFHTRKAERFAVIRGKARIELRKIGTKEVLSFVLDGEIPSFVDMPIWYTHNITNIGDEDLYTVFWINEFFDSNDTDTYFEDVTTFEQYDE